MNYNNDNNDDKKKKMIIKNIIYSYYLKCLSSQLFAFPNVHIDIMMITREMRINIIYK